MAVGGLNVEDGDLGLGPRLADDLEELALAVGLHVERDDASRAAATGRTISDLQPSADAGKLDVEEVRVHEGVDTIRAQGVRSKPVDRMVDAGSFPGYFRAFVVTKRRRRVRPTIHATPRSGAMRIVSLDHLVLTVRFFCAMANPTEVVLAETETGRGILGVVDGFSPRESKTMVRSSGGRTFCGRSGTSCDRNPALAFDSRLRYFTGVTKAGSDERRQP